MRQITWYVGTGYMRDGSEFTEAGRELRMAAALAHFTREFGGVTVNRGVGAWRNGEGRVVEEGNVQFVTIAEVDAERVDRTARFLKALYRQEAVLVAEVRCVGRMV